MAIVRYHPHKRIAQRSWFPSALLRDWTTLGGEDVASWNPQVDVAETDTEYTLRADVPGVPVEALDVQVEQGCIVLKGERSNEHEGERDGVHWSERSYGSFFRSFALPEHVDEEGIRADYADGVLTVHLPKTEGESEAAGRKVEVRQAD